MYKIHAISYSARCIRLEKLPGAVGNPKRMDEYCFIFLIQFLDKEYEAINNGTYNNVWG